MSKYNRPHKFTCPGCRKPVFWPQEGEPHEGDVWHVLCWRHEAGIRGKP